MAEPNRNSGGNVAVNQELEELTAIAPRRAGSEAERRAARQLESQLRESGRDVVIEPIRVRPAIALTHLILVLAGIVGSVLSVYSHFIGLAIVAVAAVNALGDLTGAFPGLRLLTPARASQNVVSDQDTGKPGLLILVAHYDSPRDATIFTRRFALWPRMLVGSLALITVCALIRLLGIEATFLTVLQFIPTVVLIVLAPLLADGAIAQTAAGEADNAAGVATALRLADAYAKRLEHFDIGVVLTGASAHNGLGMHEWLKGHLGDLEPAVTAVIAIDDVGGGDPAYSEKEGAVVASRMHPALLELAEAAEAAHVSTRELSDAYRTRAAGLPTLRITSERSGGSVDPDALERTYGFAADLLERIDAEVGPQIA